MAFIHLQIYKQNHGCVVQSVYNIVRIFIHGTLFKLFKIIQNYVCSEVNAFFKNWAWTCICILFVLLCFSLPLERKTKIAMMYFMKTSRWMLQKHAAYLRSSTDSVFSLQNKTKQKRNRSPGELKAT